MQHMDSAGGTQGVVDARYRLLKLGGILFLSLDVFYFFACHVAAGPAWLFPGLAGAGRGFFVPGLLRHTLLGYAIVSLPLVIHGRRMALAIHTPSGRGVPVTRGIRSIESAFNYYRHTYRVMFALLSSVNLFAAGCYIAYGGFWTFAAVSCVGFANKLVIFPRQQSFRRWMWRAVEATRAVYPS